MFSINHIIRSSNPYHAIQTQYIKKSNTNIRNRWKNMFHINEKRKPCSSCNGAR